MSIDSTSLLSRDDAIRALSGLTPDELLGFDGFYIEPGRRVRPTVDYSFSMAESLTDETEIAIVKQAASEAEGRLDLARRIVRNAPPEVRFELVLRDEG